MSEPQETVAAMLAQLGNEYRARLPLEIAQLTALAQGLADPADAHPALVDVHKRLHKLAGSGGTFGLDELSRAARALEATAQSWLDGDFSAIDAEQRRCFADAVAALSVACGLPGPDRSAP